MERVEIVFEHYSDLKKTSNLCQNLFWIFNDTKDDTSALIRLAKCHDRLRNAEFKSFNTIVRTMSIHYQNRLNFFDNRSTNSSTESFNAKIKAFRAQFRGVRNIDIFLFKLANIFA
ncbi:transposase [Patiriisocius sp. Uisw_017]|uniref:transposase n=1 Tax=Patiriisocius sp. Uisw_017 TaxID=3230968 RepID=UPI0039EBB7F6